MSSLLAASLLFIACTLLGTGVKNRYKKHYVILDGIYGMLDFCEKEISLRRPLLESLNDYVVCVDKDLKPVLTALIKKMQAGETNANDLSALLCADEKIAVCDFLKTGTDLGGRDVKQIVAIKKNVAEYRKRAKDAVDREGKMYFRLSVLAGIALMILVV